MDISTESVRVGSIAQFVAKGRWRAEGLHSLEHNLFLWFTKGQGSMLIADQRMTYGPNTIVYIPAGTPHAFDAKAGVYGNAIEVDAGETLELPDYPIVYRMRDLLLHSEWVGIFEALQREISRDEDHGKERACRFHVGLVSVWLERQENALKTARPSTGAQRLAGKYLKLLETRYGTGANVTDLAKELHVTPTHLSRACLEATGASAHALLHDRVMYEARSKLVGSKQPIQEIANDLGFSSAAYFTRAFQKSTGETPSSFRAHK